MRAILLVHRKLKDMAAAARALEDHPLVRGASLHQIEDPGPWVFRFRTIRNLDDP